MHATDMIMPGKKDTGLRVSRLEIRLRK